MSYALTPTGCFYPERSPDPFGGEGTSRSLFPWFRIMCEASPGVRWVVLDFISTAYFAEHIASQMNWKGVNPAYVR